jgi:polyphosphate kinase
MINVQALTKLVNDINLPSSSIPNNLKQMTVLDRKKKIDLGSNKVLENHVHNLEDQFNDMSIIKIYKFIMKSLGDLVAEPQEDEDYLYYLMHQLQEIIAKLTL